VANIGRFVESIQSKYGYRPTIPYGSQIGIGDVGRMKRGVWRPASTIGVKFGIDPASLGLRNPKSVGAWDTQSGKDVAIVALGRGKTSRAAGVVAKATVRGKIEFHSKRSFVFAAGNVTLSEATTFDTLVTAIRHAYHNRNKLPEERRWESDLEFVFAVGSARRFIAIFSNSKDSSLNFSGAGRIQSAADLAGSVKFGTKTEELHVSDYEPAPNCFYRAYRLKPSIFGRWDHDPLTEVRISSTEWSFPSLGRANAMYYLGSNPSPGLLGVIQVLKPSGVRTPKFDDVFEDASVSGS